MEPGNVITVTDDGRGIPVGEQKKLKKPAVEVVLTVLHAGGKFGGEGYKVSGGLHGVGVSVVNALSEWLEAEVRVDGKIHRIRFERGKTVEPLKVIGKAKKTGTKISFKPDPEIFESLDFNFDTLAQRLRELAFLNKGICIKLLDRRGEDEVKEVYKYEGGIKSFVEYLNKNKNPLHKKVIYLGAARQTLVI